MAMIGRLKDSGDWILVLQKKLALVQVQILDGAGVVKKQIVRNDQLSPEFFSVSNDRIDLTTSTFKSFPVPVYNNTGTYEISAYGTSATVVALTPRVLPSLPNVKTPTSSQAPVVTVPTPKVTETPKVTTPVPTPEVAKPVPPKPRKRKRRMVLPDITALLSAGSDNTVIVSVEKLGAYIDSLPISQSIMIWGPPGVGKSEGIYAYAEANRLKVYDWRLSMIDPTQIQGIGVPNWEKRVCEWLPNEFVPREPACLLFLDEITSAPQAIQALAYQITKDRRIGSVPLPEDCRVICAGNRRTDRAVSNEMPSPLANRMGHVTVSADVDSWKKWALTAGIDPRIIAFITAQPDFLHKMEPATSGGAWPSPRSWANASQVLDSDLDPKDMAIMFAGFVGVAAAKSFLTFAKSYQDLAPRIEDILAGKADWYVESSMERATTIGIAVVANATEDKEILRNIIRWAANQCGEYTSLVMRGLEQRFGKDVIDTLTNFPALFASKPSKNASIAVPVDDDDLF